MDWHGFFNWLRNSGSGTIRKPKRWQLICVRLRQWYCRCLLEARFYSESTSSPSVFSMTLWMLRGLPSAEFFQFIETGSTLSDVSQCRSRIDGLRFSSQLPEDGVARTVDPMWVGIVLMHNFVEGMK